MCLPILTRSTLAAALLFDWDEEVFRTTVRDETAARRILRRSGLNRRGRLELPPVVTRYEHAAVGDLLHLDIKKLGRITYLGHRATGQRHGQRHGAGWESVHVAVDDRSRVAYVELLPDEHSDTARGFVRRALAWFRTRGVAGRARRARRMPCTPGQWSRVPYILPTDPRRRSRETR